MRAEKGESLWREVAEGVQVAALRSPTIPPADSTNSACFGHSRFVLVEAGAKDRSQREQLVADLKARCAQGHEFLALVLSHHHIDHVLFARELCEEFGVALWGHRESQRSTLPPFDRFLSEGDIIDLDPGQSLKVMHTPGHAAGHLVLVHRPSGWCYAGDMVAGTGTILIDPADGGDMGAYLNSLARMRECSKTAKRSIVGLIPAHGPCIDDPTAWLSHYIQHRLAREQKVIQALGADFLDLDTLVARAYSDKPPSIWPLAKMALRAHLNKLVQEGEAETQGSAPESSKKGPRVSKTQTWAQKWRRRKA